MGLEESLFLTPVVEMTNITAHQKVVAEMLKDPWEAKTAERDENRSKKGPVDRKWLGKVRVVG